jgi:hypothetical protein
MARPRLSPEQLVHGSRSTYVNHKCRCDPCKRAHAERIAAQRAARAHLLAADPSLVKHGLVSTYLNWMCRCPECREANTAAWRRRRQVPSRQV